MCWRLDNFLGPSYITEMTFQDYIEGGKSDVKRKKFVLNPVAKVHEIFRKFMGPVDQVDVKAQVMGITRELVSAWHKKQLAFLIQTAIGNAHCNYNLDPSCKAEFFTEWYNKFLVELHEMSPNVRIYKKRKLEETENPTPKRLKRQHRKSKLSPARRREYGIASEAGLSCYGRKNLSAYIRYIPTPETRKNKRPTARRIKCKFCFLPNS